MTKCAMGATAAIPRAVRKSGQRVAKITGALALLDSQAVVHSLRVQVVHRVCAQLARDTIRRGARKLQAASFGTDKFSLDAHERITAPK